LPAPAHPPTASNLTLFHTTEERDGMLHSGMEQGLNESYAALDRLLSKLG
jgi:hypothetical protein